MMEKPYISLRLKHQPAFHPTTCPSRVKQVSNSAPATGAPAANHRFLERRITTRASASTLADAQQPKTATASFLDFTSSSAGHNSAAARYASARHVVVQHKQAQRSKHKNQPDVPELEPEKLPQQSNRPWQVHTTATSPSRQFKQQQQQQQQQFSAAAGTRRKHQPADIQGESESSIQQQGLQQLIQHRRLRQQQDNPFANAVALYRMYACSDNMVEWQQAAYGLQRLSRRVSSPLQAQQVWQAAAALQAQPLHKQCARVLGGAVVELAQVTLRNHDPSVLQALIASNNLLQFSFNKRHIDKLLLAAVAADVSLEELQALLNLVPAAMLSNRSYFVLIKSFLARQQVAEAVHCFHQMEVAGLHLTPALQQLKHMLTR